MIVFDLETLNTIKAIFYANCSYGLSKISGKFLTSIMILLAENLINVKKIVFFFERTVSKILDYVLQFRVQAKKVNNKNVKNNLYLLAHNGFGFDSFIVINIIPHWRTVVSLIKNGSGNVSLKIFNGYVDRSKKFSICTY